MRRKQISLQCNSSLQADFLSGMWAHYAQEMLNTLETGDIEEAMNAAAAVGDDNLQMKYQGRIVPDAFTHRHICPAKRMVSKGWQTGDIEQGNTFNCKYLSRMNNFKRIPVTINLRMKRGKVHTGVTLMSVICRISQDNFLSGLSLLLYLHFRINP